MFVWTVEHPEHEKVKVEADTRLNAITTAARLWGVPWTSVARDCRTDAIEKLDKPANSGTIRRHNPREMRAEPAPKRPAAGMKKAETAKKAKSQKGEHHGN